MSSPEEGQPAPEILEQDIASLGWRTVDDQLLIYGQRLAVLGVGGAGGGVAESAAREGMEVTVADPDSFDVTNLNRQTGSYRDTVDINKAASIGRLISRIRGEDSGVRVYETGMTHGNIDEILEDATLVLDAIDIARPDLSITLARKARAAGLPVFMGIEIGLGATVTCFAPDAPEEATVEAFFGIEPDEEVDQDTVIPLERILVHMPSYTPDGMLEAFMDGRLPSTPGVHPGVLLLSGSMMTAIDRWVIGSTDTYPQFVYPNIYVIDPIDGMMVVHADEREEHLMTSLENIGSPAVGSGFSTPDEYSVMRHE